MSLDPDTKPVCYAFSLTPWQDPWMNRQQLLSRLGRRGWRVVYSTGALNIWERNTDTWRSAPLFARQHDMDGVRVDLAGRSLPVWPSRPRYSAWAIARYCASLQRRAATARHKDAIVYLFWPKFLPYALAVGYKHLVYHAVDSYAGMPGWNTELENLEKEAVARADLLIGTTEQALARLPPGGSAPRHVLPNGADVMAYARGPDLPCPEDLARIPQPRICYAGNLNRKVDFNLIAAIAHARPVWHWVIVGPTIEGMGHPSRDPMIAEGYTACCRLPNVHFLGCKTVAELPAYMGHADANVMCYRSDDGGWWSSGYPLKLHEYLACGMPVISAPLTAVQPFAHVVDLASSVDEWLAALERALYHGGVGTPEQRRAVANENTWDMRVDRIEEWLYEMLGRKS